jgi:hypothetical protein
MTSHFSTAGSVLQYLVEEGIAWGGAAHAIRALGISTEPSGVAVENPIGVGLTCVIMAVADV